jgi:hypothetical protein
LTARFKINPSVTDQDVYDPMAENDRGEIKASRRAAAFSQTLTFEDVAALAHYFGVSYQAALFRMKSLAIVNAPEFEELREKESLGLRFLVLHKVMGRPLRKRVSITRSRNRRPGRSPCTRSLSPRGEIVWEDARFVQVAWSSCS